MTNNMEYYPTSGVTITSGSFESFFSGEGSVSITRNVLNAGLGMALSEDADIDYPDIYKISLRATHLSGTNQGYYDANNTWVSIPSSKVTKSGNLFIITDPQIPSGIRKIFLGSENDNNTFSEFAIYDSNNNNITLAAEKPEDTGLSTANMLGAYVGSEEVAKIYLGTEVVYESATPTPTPTGGIHLTSDGLGIVFPAGTYTNTDGYKDFTIGGASGRTQSDSITFDTDITFPSRNSSETVNERYRWNESNVDTINPQITRFTMYDGGGQNYGHSLSFDSTTASGILSTSYGFCSSSSGRYINNNSYSYCYGYYDSTYNAYPNYGDSYGGYVSGFECRITHTVGRAIELPQEKIYLALRSGGSQISAANVSGRIDTTKSYLGVYSSTTSSFVKQWYSTGANSSGYLTFNFGSDTDYTLNENEYYVLRIVFSAKLSALYSYQAGGVNQLNLTKWGYQVMTPKIVKLGLSGDVMDYSPDFVDKDITLASDTRNGWNLGYVKFSATEVGKLVQYSKTPIT